MTPEAQQKMQLVAQCCEDVGLPRPVYSAETECKRAKRPSLAVRPLPGGVRINPNVDGRRIGEPTQRVLGVIYNVTLRWNSASFDARVRLAVKLMSMLDTRGRYCFPAFDVIRNGVDVDECPPESGHAVFMFRYTAFYPQEQTATPDFIDGHPADTYH
ncbi:MAG: hypothetical protein AAGI08_00220 [Bacteroidota bacterium]